MSEEKYFRFPLAILQGINHNGKPCNSTPFDIIDDALDYAIVSAGLGLIHTQGQEGFDKILEARGGEGFSTLNLSPYASAGLVGASLCGVTIGSRQSLDRAGDVYAAYQNHKFPLVTMKADIFWSAFYQTGYEQGKKDPPDRGISWREFRILCAILSVKINREGFSFMGWQEIQARSCGMLRKPYKARKRIPDHLAPPYSQTQIKRTCDRLEALNFFARCRHSKGPRGGFMAYSFRHSPEKLREAVASWASFRRGDSVRENRAKDIASALKNKERQ